MKTIFKIGVFIIALSFALFFLSLFAGLMRLMIFPFAKTLFFTGLGFVVVSFILFTLSFFLKNGSSKEK